MSDTPSTNATLGTGETPRAREAIDDMIRRQRGDGVPYEQAKRRAIETARRYDRKKES